MGTGRRSRLENDDPGDARRALQRSRALAPGRTDMLLFLADLERRAGNAQAAIGDYRALLVLAPGAAKQAFDLARLLAASGDDAHDEGLPRRPASVSRATSPSSCA